MLADDIEQYDGQDRPAGQDVDGLIRGSQHEEQAAEQEDDAGQAKDADARRRQFQADAEQTDQEGGDDFQAVGQGLVARQEQQAAEDEGRSDTGADAGHLDFCQQGGDDQGDEDRADIGILQDADGVIAPVLVDIGQAGIAQAVQGQGFGQRIGRAVGHVEFPGLAVG